MFSERAAKIAFLLAAVCPFLANYCAAALSETLEIFFTALALDLAIAGLQKHKNLCWIGCGLACSGAIFLRPDGGLLPMAIGLYLLVLVVRNVLSKHSASIKKISTSQLIRVGIIFSVASLAPLIPWAARNWITMHRFQPLAPRYANEDDEYVDIGFNRWVKTWMVDYVSVEEIYWNVPGIKIDAKLLPSRAFDSSEQKQQTEQLIDQYNSTLDLDPQLDQKFNSLADARIHQRPLRYYVKLPFLRIADMWLRPRTELLPPDPRWWQFNDDRRWLTVALGFGLLNFAYVGLACLGAWRERSLPFLGLLLTFVILRSVFLGSLENPETRYTLECYPAVVLFIAALFRTS
jgi:4-amino-4-deoxy-L-arabinose transferase-like glycosyltransferase